MSENIHHLSGNLLVGSSHLFVDTTNNRVGITTADPDAGLHVNSNAYVHTDFRVGSGIEMNVTSGRITATGGFSGDGSGLSGVNSDSGSWVNGSSSNIHLATSTNKVGIGVVSPGAELHVAGTGAIIIPSGNTSQRPGGLDGMLRVNTETGFLEVYNGAWISVVPDRPIGWEIIMRTSGRKTQYSSAMYAPFGITPSSTFRSITASSTGASSRTSFGDGVGLYEGFFTKTGITKIALVSGTGNYTDMTSHSQYIVYDLVESTNAESLYDIIKRLDDYNLNNSSWAGNDSLFGASSVINFTAGTNGFSGTRTGGVSSGIRDETGAVPERFCIWGINRDSDNDTQVLCAYSNNLQTGKGDQWRGGQPKQSFWSYWGNDWHSNSVSQTISRGNQSNPGIGDSVNTYTGDIYLMAS